jgi:hypothetical protein
MDDFGFAAPQTNGQMRWGTIRFDFWEEMVWLVGTPSQIQWDANMTDEHRFVCAAEFIQIQGPATSFAVMYSSSS